MLTEPCASLEGPQLGEFNPCLLHIFKNISEDLLICIVKSTGHPRVVSACRVRGQLVTFKIHSFYVYLL